MKREGFKRKRPITKMALFLRAMRFAFWLSIVFGVLIALMALFGGDGVQRDAQEIVRFVGSSTLMFFAFMVLTLFPVVMVELSWIRRQEKHYGISFNEEMRKHGIKGYVHMDQHWLILVTGCRIYSFRKGFITDFGEQRKSLFGKRMGSKVMVACEDGKARVIVGTGATLTAIADWALGPEEPEDLSENPEE